MMRRSRVCLKVGSAIVAGGLCAAPALADAPAKAAVAQPGGGPGSLAGVWFNAQVSRVRVPADGKPIPYRPAARAEVDKRLKGAKPTAGCLPAGVPQMMQPPPRLPIEIVETPGQVTVLFSSLTTFRIIRMDEGHPDDPDPTFMGNSVGHWEGRTLVVDTIALNERTTIDGVVPHSDQLHVVERLRRTGPGALEDLVTIDDPKTFTRPYAYRFTYRRTPGAKVREDLCDLGQVK